MFKKNISNTVWADHAGITLLELTVSVFLFAMTMVMAAGIFSAVVRSQRVAVSSEDLQENIRYSFERMGKEVRTAIKTDSSHPCIPSGNIYYSPTPGQLEFVNYRGQCVNYYLNSGQIYVSYPNSTDLTLKNGLPLTPKEITISKLAFRITDSATKIKAAVAVRMHMAVGLNTVTYEQIDVETYLSSRNYQ